MKKMKYRLYNRIQNDTSLSRLELRLLFYLAAHQDEYGRIDGVYYDDVCKELDCSVSGFYLVRDSLVEKEYIEWDKSVMSDMDILLYDNSFVVDGEIRYEEYVDLNINIFNNREFWKCKAGAIRTAMYVIKRAGAAGAITFANSLASDAHEAELKRKLWFRRGQEMKSLKRILKVSVRVIKEYLKQLKEFMSLADVQKEGITYKVLTVNKKSLIHKKSAYPEQDMYIQKVSTYCRRSKIEYDKQHLSSTADLIRQYSKIAEEMGASIITCLCRAITLANDSILSSFNTHNTLRSILKNISPEHPVWYK